MSAPTLSFLAMRSLRARLGSFVACGLSVFLGTVVMAGFVSLMETSLLRNVSPADAQTLIIMGGVIGGWGVFIVLTAVASTVAITVRQRSAELHRLRAIGATNRQVRSLVCRETAVVALFATLLGLVPGLFLGRLLLNLITEAGMVEPGISHRYGPLTAGGIALLLPLLATVAAGLAVRNITPRTVEQTTDTTEPAGLSRVRRVTGLGLLAWALLQALVGTIVSLFSEDPFMAMQMLGSLSIVASLGLALLAPPVLAAAAHSLAGSNSLTTTAHHLATTAHHLATTVLSRRPLRASGTLIPIVMFVGISAGTLVLMVLHHRFSIGAADNPDAETFELLNYVVVGVVSIFAAIMIITTVTATVLDRRVEIAHLRRAGATGGDVVRAIAAEGLILAAVGSALGLIGSLATIIPFGIVKIDGALPSEIFWNVAGSVVGAFVLTVGASWWAASRAVRVCPSAVLAA